MTFTPAAYRKFEATRAGDARRLVPALEREVAALGRSFGSHGLGLAQGRDPAGELRAR